MKSAEELQIEFESLNNQPQLSKTNELKYKSNFQQSIYGTFVFDSEGKSIDIYQRTCDLINYNNQEFLHPNITSFLQNNHQFAQQKNNAISKIFHAGIALDEMIFEENPFAVHTLDEKEKQLKILIAEDDETSEIHLNILLDRFAREIIHAQNGSEAIALCRQHPDIDLILMDIKMPVINGYEATREIRKFNKRVLIIAQTAYNQEGDREKALEAGCNDYLPKPLKKNNY